jgi:2-oxoglutarate ferredoxin oxidoreductase subunit beta
LEAVTLGENGVTAADILVHDETNRALAQHLAALEPPFPTAMGVLYCNPAPSYEREVYAQGGGSQQDQADLDVLLRKERTWVVEG